MAAQDDYTPEEWKLLVEAPGWAGLGVAKADFGVISFARELKALVQGIAQARRRYPHNPLIQAVVAELQKPDGTEDNDDHDDGLSVEAVLKNLRQVNIVLALKAPPDQAIEYKGFLYALAESTARAGGKSLFGNVVKLSAKEEAYLKDLKGALGV